jgi:hypothetical protein
MTVRSFVKLPSVRRLFVIGGASSAAASLLWWGAACGGTNVVDRGDPTRATLVISPEGGTLVGPLGASITVPAGALTADTALSIAVSADGTYTPLPDGAAPLGAVFAFTPHDLAFGAPARIVLPATVGDAAAPIVVRAANEGAPWTLGPPASASDAGTFSFETSRLSLYAVVDPGPGGPTALFPAGDSCSPELRASRWTTMLTQPIVLLGRAAGVDIAGSDKSGATRAEIEALLCSGTSKGATFGADTETVAWGNGAEVSVVFDSASAKARYAVLTGGYTGALEFKARDGATPYRIELGKPMQKATAPLAVPWSDPAALTTLMSELEDALVATFVPTTPKRTTPCTEAPATCERGSLGALGYLYFRSVGVALWVGDTSAAERSNTPTRLDVYAR